MLFLRMWLFTLMVAVFEAVFYQATNALFFLLAVAVLGLRFAAGARVIGAAPR